MLPNRRLCCRARQDSRPIEPDDGGTGDGRERAELGIDPTALCRRRRRRRPQSLVVSYSVSYTRREGIFVSVIVARLESPYQRGRTVWMADCI